MMRSISSLKCAKFAGLNSFYSCKRDLSKSIQTSPFNTRTSTIIVGAVSYSDNVSSIWEGIRQHYVKRGIALDFILFTSYERQLEYLMSGDIDIAWNGPIAHARLQRLAKGAVSLGMRDVDRDFAACILCTKKSGIKNILDIESKRLATGSYDSPQAYVLPMHHLIGSDINLSKIDVVRFDRDIGNQYFTQYGISDSS
jgi:phosphonate transport system substrate-binding protein